jgi:hypothetical protein
MQDTPASEALCTAFANVIQRGRGLEAALLADDAQRRFEGWILRDSALSHDLWPVAETQSAHEASAALYQCLTYPHEGDGRITWRLPGILMVSDRALATAEAFNQAKAVFENCLHTFGRGMSRSTASRKVRELLATEQGARVHIRHVTRRVLILPERPRSIGLSWVRSQRSIVNVDKHWCLDQLDKLGGDHPSWSVRHDRLKVEQLASGDVARLRFVQQYSQPLVAARAAWLNGQETHVGYLAMPALVPGQSQPTLPPMTDLAASPGSRRRTRKDRKIGSEPWLASLPVFLTEKDSGN